MPLAPIRRLLAGTLLALSLSGCFLVPSRPDMPDGPIAFEAPELYPEGVAAAPDGGFFVSSLHYGTIGHVALDGTYRPFAAAGPLVSTQGIAVDTTRNRLLVVGGDLGVGERTTPASDYNQAGMAIYNLSTGALQQYVTFDGLTSGYRHANDLALAPDGGVYVTDSFAGVIYHVTLDGVASVAVRDSLFASGENVGANGIALLPDSRLLVAQSRRGELYRVTPGTPARVEAVTLPEPLQGIDGIRLVSANTMVAVQNEGADRTLLLRSTDGWRSAVVLGTTPSVLPFPTTAALTPHGVYVLNAKLDELFDPAAPHSSNFLLQRVEF